MELTVKRTEQTQDLEQDMETLHKRAPVIGVRHLQSLLLFLGVVCSYLLRVNLSVTIVAMNPVVNSTDYYKEISQHIPIFGWPTSTRSLLLSSFFAGYMLSNIPASVLGCRFDNKILLAYSMIVSSLLAIVSPLAVLKFGAPVLIGIRFMQGLSSAFTFPMVHGIMARWTPPNERSQLAGFVFSGIQLGTMVTLAISGILSSSSMGWPIVYYTSGVTGLVWTVIWLLLGSESLSKHRFVSKAEADYIRASLSNTVGHKIKLSDTPWKSIYTSMPVWATTVAHVGHNWGFWLLLTEMPTFMNTVLKFNIKEDGLLSAMPYFAMFLLQLPVSYTADLLNKRKITSMTVSRKIWNTIAFWGGTASLITLGYLENTTMVLVLYIFTVAIGCTSNSGFNINHLDLSPNYAGLLMGITNTAASCGGIFAPLIAGLLIKDQTSVFEWQKVFISGAVVLFLCNLFFIIFGSAKTQPWNSLNTDASNTENNKQETEIVG